MLTSPILKKLQKEQNELDKIIHQQSAIKFEWISLWNAKRLKLALFTEIAEFANELKTFKIWRKKKETDWPKAKEELIDCLCFFLGLTNIFQINFSNYQFQFSSKEKEFNDLLLKLFSQTEKLKISASTKLTEIQINTYYNWLQIFNEIIQKLKMNESEVLAVYLHKVNFNKERAKKGY